MGECSDCYKSSEELAIERITERLFRSQQNGPSTDCTDRALRDQIRQQVLDEFILVHGRAPKGIFD